MKTPKKASEVPQLAQRLAAVTTIAETAKAQATARDAARARTAGKGWQGMTPADKDELLYALALAAGLISK